MSQANFGNAKILRAPNNQAMVVVVVVVVVVVGGWGAEVSE